MIAPLPQDMIDKARAVRIESVIAERGIKLSPGRIERCGPCPVCGGINRFSINIRKQVFNCRGCRAKGDAIALVQHIDGGDFREAVERLAGEATEGRPAPCLRHQRPKLAIVASGPDNTPAARRLWAESIPIDGTLGELYLRVSRELAVDEDLSHCIRFNDRTPWLDGAEVLRVPCLISAMRSIVYDEIMAIQKTWLAPDGSKRGRRMFGPARGAAIKIDRDENVTYGVTVGEGLETCLAGRELGFRPCWALGSAGAVDSFPVLTGIDALTLLAETDDDGVNAKAVEACACRWLDAGREVLFATPGFIGDMNDALRGITA